jgi:hypothetical protein
MIIYYFLSLKNKLLKNSFIFLFSKIYELRYTHFQWLLTKVDSGLFLLFNGVFVILKKN